MKPKRWQDHYTRQAQKENFPARSVFKLKEMQQRYRLVQPGGQVLDLGCSPGSWLLYAAQLTGPGGRVLGIDITPVQIHLPAHVQVCTADIFDTEALKAVGLKQAFDVVLSDMAPATTGQKVVDAARSLALCERALEVAMEALVTGGAFVCKVFQSEDFQNLHQSLKNTFNQTSIFKPRSSRKASREIYLIGMGKKQEA